MIFLRHTEHNVFYMPSEPRSGIIIECRCYFLNDVSKQLSYDVYSATVVGSQDSVLGSNFIASIPYEEKYLTQKDKAVPVLIYGSLDILINKGRDSFMETGGIIRDKMYYGKYLHGDLSKF